ncbi:pilus assembly PilX family protein [Sphaerotilaceae bacterium SBD11-9]
MVVALIMLVLIVMISATTIRSSTMDEKMAGNSRDRNRAFQAAELALRSCLTRIQDGSYTGTSPTQLSPATGTAVQVWEDPSNWTSDVNSVAVTVSADGGGLSAAPRCLFEAWPVANAAIGGLNYRVTARAVGGSEQTVVILQATSSLDQ